MYENAVAAGSVAAWLSSALDDKEKKGLRGAQDLYRKCFANAMTEDAWDEVPPSGRERFEISLKCMSQSNHDRHR
jgi:hypothetical protein